MSLREGFQYERDTAISLSLCGTPQQYHADLDEERE